MFGVGFGEIVLIVIVALLVFGPEKMPELAKQVGKGLRELKKASNDLQNSFHEAVYSEEMKELRDRYRPPQLMADPAAQPRELGHANLPPEALAKAIASAQPTAPSADPTPLAPAPVASSEPVVVTAPPRGASEAPPEPASPAGGERS